MSENNVKNFEELGFSTEVSGLLELSTEVAEIKTLEGETLAIVDMSLRNGSVAFFRKDRVIVLDDESKLVDTNDNEEISNVWKEVKTQVDLQSWDKFRTQIVVETGLGKDNVWIYEVDLGGGEDLIEFKSILTGESDDEII